MRRAGSPRTQLGPPTKNLRTAYEHVDAAKFARHAFRHSFARSDVADIERLDPDNRNRAGACERKRVLPPDALPAARDDRNATPVGRGHQRFSDAAEVIVIFGHKRRKLLPYPKPQVRKPVKRRKQQQVGGKRNEASRRQVEADARGCAARTQYRAAGL